MRFLALNIRALAVLAATAAGIATAAPRSAHAVDATDVPDPCADLRGLPAGDPIEPVARCTEVLSSRYQHDPTLRVTAMNGCLLRGWVRHTSRKYYVLKASEVEVDTGHYPGGVISIDAEAMDGGYDETYGFENADHIVFQEITDDPIHSLARTLRMKVVYDKAARTLVYEESSRKDDRHPWSYNISTLVRCEPVTLSAR